jgi:hypothetical protein
MTTKRRKPPAKEVRRFTLQNVISSEVTLNLKLRLKLSCGHVTEVDSFRPGKQARCYECGKEKNLEYHDE